MKRLLAALLSAAIVAGAAQQTGAVSLVDVVALDGAGRAVAGLKPADFEITADGKPAEVIRETYLDTVRHTAVSATPLPALETAPDEIHRTTVFVVDDLCLPRARLARVRDELNGFVANELARGDVAAILRTSGGTPRERELTGEPARLSAALAAIQYLGGGVSQASCARAAWTAVNYALNGLAGLPGRKAVVLISGELAAPPGNVGAAIARRAAAAMAAVYRTAEDASGFAESTGGAADANPARVAAETASYYALGFESEARNVPVEVRVKRAGVTLRARRHPAGSPRARLQFVPDDEMSILLEAANSPFAGTAIGLRATPLFNNTAAGGQLLQVLCHIDARGLSYLRDEKGLYRFDFRVGAGEAPEAGRVVSLMMSGRAMHLTREEFERAMREGVLVDVQLPGGSGAQDVRAVVEDTLSGRTGSANAFVELQNPARGGLFLSSIVLRGADDVRESPAVRSFHPGASLEFVYNIYNLTLDKAGRSQATSRVEMFAGGRTVFEGKEMALSFEPGPDPRRRHVSGRIRLDPTVGQGRYILHVTVTDMLAPRARTAGGFVDFTVEP